MNTISKGMLEKYLLESVFNVTDVRDRMILDVAALVHEDDWTGAGSFYGAWVRKNKDKNFPDPKNKDGVVAIVTQLFHWCLNNKRYWLAARLLWHENQFDARPHFTRMVFDAWTNNAAVMLMGSASASKSYSSGVWLLLDWLRDPDYTCVKVLGPSEQHLADNLFTHLVNLHQSASIPLPGETGDLFIGMDRRNRFGSISGVVVPVGKKSAGRLQGSKAGNKKRKVPHPEFGITGRLRVFMDESEKIPSGIWKDVDNIFSNLTGTEVFKIGCAYNPEDVNGPSGVRSEPPDGWINFDIDQDEKWMSRRGWWTVRLDGFKGENVQENEIIFPGLQTREGIDRLIENAGGFNSPGYYTMARAAFPPTVSALTVITQQEIDSAVGNFVFLSKTRPVSACDLALEGGDAAPFAVGEFGYAIGYKTRPTLRDPNGVFVQFKNMAGEQVARPALQINAMFKLDRGDSVAMSTNLRDLNQKIGVEPEWFAMDRTGVGQGTFDILSNFWSPSVIGVNYMGAASDTKILEEDTKTCKEEYDRLCSELWFALKKWLRFGMVMFSPSMNLETLSAQLTGRRYHPLKVNRVESKKDYKARNAGKSPDEADTITLAVHAVRKASGEVPSMKTSVGSDRAPSSHGFSTATRSYSYTDPTNRVERGID